MNQAMGRLLSPPLEGEQAKQQRIPVIIIEALPGGYALTEGAGWSGQRRSVVPNTDALLATIRTWARDAEARELAGDNAGKG